MRTPEPQPTPEPDRYEPPAAEELQDEESTAKAATGFTFTVTDTD
jgi:hypothetical protein